MSDVLAKDPEARSLIIGISISLYYGISSWSQVLVWPAVQAPYYKYGWQSSIALLTLTIIMTCTLRYLDVKFYRKRTLVSVEAVEVGEEVEEEGVDGMNRDKKKLDADVLVKT